MPQSRKTKVLLILFGIVLLIGIGMISYAYFDGTLSSSADTTYGTVSGSVKGETSNVAIKSGVIVLQSGPWQKRTSISTTGTYAISGVPLGKTYDLTCSANCSSNFKAKTFTMDTASKIINFTMPDIPWIKGHVSMPNGTDAANRSVRLYRINSNGTLTIDKYATTDAKGYYIFYCITKNQKYKIIAQINSRTAYPKEVTVTSDPGKIVDFP